MRHGILGTGLVGQTLAAMLVERGHEFRAGGRSRRNEKIVVFARKAGHKASHGDLADAAFGEVFWCCTRSDASL